MLKIRVVLTFKILHLLASNTLSLALHLFVMLDM